MRYIWLCILFCVLIMREMASPKSSTMLNAMHLCKEKRTYINIIIQMRADL